MDNPKILNIQQATKILRSAGMPIKETTLRIGLLQGTFPFGTAVHATKNNGLTQSVFWVWEPLLEQWMAERHLKKGEVIPYD